jgi:hypothetical protein
MTGPVLRSKELERHIEAYLTKRVEGCGGLAYKFTSPQRANVPDRLILIPSCGMGGVAKGDAVFVEVKAPGKAPTSGQIREHDRLIKLGFAVYVIDSKEGVDGFIKAEFGK